MMETGANQVTVEYVVGSQARTKTVPLGSVAKPIEERSAAARAAPRWIRSAESSGCMLCRAEFGLFTHRHHCRRCGWAVCASCSGHKAVLDRWLEPDKPHALREDRRSDEPLRVCDLCHRALGGGAGQPAEGVPPEPERPSAAG